MARDPRDLLYGSLDMLILRALAWEPMHGYAISNFIRERTAGVLEIVDAALYKSLQRLERQWDSLAAQAGQGVSAYVLSRALPKARLRFEELVAALGEAEDRRFALAELNEVGLQRFEGLLLELDPLEQRRRPRGQRQTRSVRVRRALRFRRLAARRDRERREEGQQGEQADRAEHGAP